MKKWQHLIGVFVASATVLVGMTEDKINGNRDSEKAKESKGRSSSWAEVPTDYSVSMVQKWADAHKSSKGDGFKYVYLPVDIAKDKKEANVLRVAMTKAWNHLSWKKEIDIPADISEGAGLAFALDINKLWDKDATENWGVIANCSPKSNISVSPAASNGCDQFEANQPVEIPRFVFNAVNGGPYANIHQTPPDTGSFNRKFNPGKVELTSTHKDAIVCGPRITGYQKVQIDGVERWYSFTSDEFFGRNNGDINYTQAPTDNDLRGTGAFNAAPNDGSTAIATEWWMQLPNGFMYWGIHGEGSQERGRAESPFAIDPANVNQNYELQTGRSCISCHTNGVQSAPSDKEFAGRNGWSSNEDLSKMYDEVREQFQASMKVIVDEMSDSDEETNNSLVQGTIEPVSRAIMRIEGPYRQGSSDCQFFCDGKFSSQGKNLCETLPPR